MHRLRGRGPSFGQVQGNVFSDKVPGGNLILGVLDRDLMTWSDRGKASKYFGDCWSELVSQQLNGQVGSYRQLHTGDTFELSAVVRLDDDSRIAIQAGRHKLTNPDFVLFGRKAGGEPVLQAADSKFSVDTIKPVQVSAEALQALLEVENGLVRAALEETVGDHAVSAGSVERGVFFSPMGPLTDFYLPRLLSDPKASVESSHIELLPADPARLFGRLDEAKLIGPLARIDRLPVSPRDHLLAAIYYLRVACACAWLWVEERTPLLSLDQPLEVDIPAVEEQLTHLSKGSESAFGVVTSWFESVEQVTRNRKALKEVMSLPMRMTEIRKLVESAGFGDDRRLVRTVRAALDRSYRHRILEEVGEVPAKPDQPLPAVLQRVANVSRSLRPEFHKRAVALIETFVEERAADSSAATQLDS